MATDLTHLRIDPALKNAVAATPTRRRWVIGLVIAIVLVAALVLWWERPTSSGKEEVVHAMPAATQPGASGGASDQDFALHAVGYIVAAHKVELAAKVIGRVSWVGVEMGDKVKKGQPLVRLEDDEYRARLRQAQGQFNAAKAKLAELVAGSRPQEIDHARADLDQAQAEFQNAEVTVKRDREMVESRAISRQTLDDAQAKYDSAVAKVNAMKAAFELARIGTRQEQIDAQRAMVEQAQGLYDLAKVDHSNTIIYAPTDGTILERNVEVGEFVTTGFVGDRGAKGYVVSIADLNDLRVELDIDQGKFNKVALGQHCTVTTDAYPDRRYDGVVDLIAPQANRQKATVLTKVKVLNPDDLLRPEMNATVLFHALPTTQPASRP